MSLFDVHVNRIPSDGVVRQVSYRRGRFRPAMKHEASLENEQNTLVLDTPGARELVFTQVAGLIARRIVCFAEEGEQVRRGDIFGAVMFGSRVDVYCPPEVDIRVGVGDHVKGGVSVLGVIS
jgi:phosphatidylserine decarboxylase